MTTEIITLPQAPSEEILGVLLGVGPFYPGTQVTVHIRRGEDAAGRSRVQVSLSHESAEQVAQARESLLRACRAQGVRAFVV